MTTYGIYLLAAVIVAMVILFVVLSRSAGHKKAKETPAEAKGKTEAFRPPEKAETAKRPVWEPTPGVTKKPPEKKPPEEPAAKEPVIIKKHTPVYEYTPTRGTVRCRICDGENARGAALCGICGNYITD